jgi:sugar lactone lactonase YvrE
MKTSPICVVALAVGLAACGGGEGRRTQQPPSESASRDVPAAGMMITVAGGGSELGDGGPATSAGTCAPADVAVGDAGRLYIADWGSDCNGPGGNRIRAIDADGRITTVAGNGLPGAGGDGGPAKDATLGRPTAVAVDADGAVYFSDMDNQRIRKVDPGGTITTFAGTGERGHLGDGGPARAARLMDPGGLAFDADGNLYLAEFAAVRRIDPSGTITTVAGTGRFGRPSGLDLPPTPRFRGEGGPAKKARLNPSDVAVDARGNLFIANGRWVHKVDRDGIIRRIAGTAAPGKRLGDGGPATSAALELPLAIALDRHGNLLISDIAAGRVRMVDARGRISTVAGAGTAGRLGERGPASRLALRNPIGIDVDSRGVLYIAEEQNARIRAVRYR